MRKKLTDESVKAAKVAKGKTRFEIYDADCPGLVLRVSSKAKSYWFYFRFGGKFIKHQIGDAAKMKLHAAHEAARNMRDRVRAGVDPRGAAGDEAPDTFEELAALYVKNYAMQNRRSWQDDVMLLRVHVTEAIGKRRLVTLDGPTMARLHHDIVAKRRRHDAAIAVKNGRSPRAHAGGRIADRVLDLIKAILRWGIPLGYVMGDFTIGIRKAGAKGGRKRALEDHEIAAFLAALPAIFTDERIQVAVRLTLMLGSRKMEVLGMRRDELTLCSAAPFWRMLGPDADRGKEGEHIVPLIPEAINLIKRALELSPAEHELVFVSPKTNNGFDAGVPNTALAKAFRVYQRNVRDKSTGKFVSIERAPILTCPRFTIHDLRRTAGTGMARIGIDRLHISKALGHKAADRETMTGIIYDRHAYMAEKRFALTRWAAHLASLVVLAFDEPNTTDANVNETVCINHDGSPTSPSSRTASDFDS